MNLFRGTEAAERGRHVKRLFLAFAVLVLLAISAGSMVMMAQESSPTEYVMYTVKSGNTLWGLTSSQWEVVVKENPWLKSRVERKSADLVIVWIYPGESILVPSGCGIEQTLEIESPVLAKLAVSPAPDSNNSSGKAETVSASVAKGSLRWWSWLLGWLFVGGMLGYFGRRVFQDPATAGPAIVPGGIPPGETESLEDRFAQIANRRHGEINPLAGSVEQPIRVGPIEEGTLSGWGWIRFRNFLRRFMHMNRAPAYRARFRFANSTEEDLFFLQRCANDVVAGTRYLGFRFEPGRVVVPTPAPPTEEPARRQAAIHLVDPGHPETRPTRIVIAGSAEIEIPNGGTIEIDHKGNCSVTVGGMTFTAKARRPAQTRSTKPAAGTGTDGTQ